VKLQDITAKNEHELAEVVAVHTLKEHPIYRKKYKITTKFKAHDAENTCHTGDLVEITESRPLSRDKRWVVARKVSAKELEV
jgi:small subunit ribosomal protein S17